MPNINTPKQLVIKLKKLKNTSMASFRAKIGRKWPRKSENKNYRSISLLFDVYLKIPKKLKNTN